MDVRADFRPTLLGRLGGVDLKNNDKRTKINSKIDFDWLTGQEKRGFEGALNKLWPLQAPWSIAKSACRVVDRYMVSALGSRVGCMTPARKKWMNQRTSSQSVCHYYKHAPPTVTNKTEHNTICYIHDGAKNRSTESKRCQTSSSNNVTASLLQITTLQLSLTMKEFWKSVSIWQSYRQLYSGSIARFLRYLVYI